jgi:hypothetical protein
MATTQGTAIVWGVSTTNLTGFTAAVSGAYTVTGEDVASEADSVELKDRNGEIASVYYYNGRTTLSLKCYPSGASASATALPSIGEKVAVAAATDSDIAGDWICNSISKARTSEGIVEFDIGLISYDGVTPS